MIDLSACVMRFIIRAKDITLNFIEIFSVLLKGVGGGGGPLRLAHCVFDGVEHEDKWTMHYFTVLLYHYDEGKGRENNCEGSSISFPMCLLCYMNARQYYAILHVSMTSSVM